MIQLGISDLLVKAVPWSEINICHEPSSAQLLMHLGGREKKKGRMEGEWEGGREGGWEGGKAGREGKGGEGREGRNINYGVLPGPSAGIGN